MEVYQSCNFVEVLVVKDDRETGKRHNFLVKSRVCGKGENFTGVLLGSGTSYRECLTRLLRKSPVLHTELGNSSGECNHVLA